MESQEAIFKRFIRNECTPQEIEGLLAQFNKAGNEAALREIIMQALSDGYDNITDGLPNLDEKEAVIYAALLPHLRQKQVVYLLPQIAAAAILILGLSIGFYFLKYKTKTNSAQKVAQHDIAPGRNKAFLTLANGQKISLTDANNGQVANQAGVKIVKSVGGVISYNPDSTAYHAAADALGYNMVETPKGGQYQVNLPDGTEVWLNAASSLKYPTSFTAFERKVELTGEAYFEVAHDKKHPFLLQTKKQTITVLGTRFNVNVYNDEPEIKTTLLEGSVKINAGLNTSVIKPGQQAVLLANKLSVGEVDTDEVIAWKNGMFQFSNENLESIMRKISRWYDVDVEYVDSGVKNLPLTGIITHFSNASKVLRMLELTKQVHFKIEGRKIIVMK